MAETPTDPKDDQLPRIFWTIVAAGLAELVTSLTEVSGWWVPVAAAAVTAALIQVRSKLGVA